MAWITTDTDVACSLVVNKTVNGQPVPGYPVKYSILEPFGDYPALTENAWQKAGSAARTTRIAAFKIYVGGLEGVAVDSVAVNAPTRISAEIPGRVVEE